MMARHMICCVEHPSKEVSDQNVFRSTLCRAMCGSGSLSLVDTNSTVFSGAETVSVEGNMKC